MIRVGFIFNENICYWNGGINYYRNLIKILLDSKKFTPVIFCPNSIYNEVRNRFDNIEIVTTEIIANSSVIGKIRKLIMYMCGRVPFLDGLLKRNHIDVVSHSTSIPMDKKCSCPSCNWIPDFQQHHLPDYFSKKRKRRQYYVNSLLIKNSSKIIVSSYDAKDDLMRFYPFTNEKKIEVLQFSVPPKENILYSEDILKNYSVEKNKYYMVSNQFWAHKNHMVVLKAAKKLLEKEGMIPFKIVATGKKFDPRYPQYFEKIKRYIEENKLGQYFICTGEISYIDVMALQTYSIAIIQPSLFEGWNTTVEECKQIGKKIILSDIDIHREQNPDNVEYFDPFDVNRLTEILTDIYVKYSNDKENEEKEMALNKQNNRWNEFSLSYITILNKTLKYGNRYKK